MLASWWCFVISSSTSVARGTARITASQCRCRYSTSSVPAIRRIALRVSWRALSGPGSVSTVSSS